MFDAPFGFEEDLVSCRVPYRPLWLTGRQAEERELFAIVDNEFYGFAMQWRWNAVPSKQNEFNERKWKWYASRVVRVDGRGSKCIRLWLHKEICLRAHGLPPSPRHIMVDHINGNSLDCRQDNLRWATPSMNRQNYNGYFALQLRLDFKGGHTKRRLATSDTRGRRIRGARCSGSAEAALAGADD